MAQETLAVPNISCEHCVSAIESELSEMAGIQSVDADASNKTVTIQFDAPASIARIRARLAEINYPAQQ